MDTLVAVRGANVLSVGEYLQSTLRAVRPCLTPGVHRFFILHGWAL